MTGTFLKLVGAVTILGVLGAGAASAFLVKERFHVTIAGDASEQKAGPDPVTLLRDDVSSLRRDLTSLSQVLSKNFETLAAQGDASDAAAEDARHRALQRDLAPVEASLAKLSERIDALGAAADARDERARREAQASLAEASARIEARLQAVERLEASRALAATAPADAPAPHAVPPPPAAPAHPAVASTPPPPTPVPAAGPAPARVVPTSTAAAPPAPTPVATTAAAGPAPTVASAPAPTPMPTTRRKGFLSFSLPSESLDLEHPQKFEIVASLSRVGFDAKSTLHDFTGVTSETSGTFVATLARPGVGTTGHVEATAASIDTGVEDRNAEMRRILDVARFPAVTFDLLSYEATTVDPKTGASTGTGRGRFTMHGVARDLAMPLRISLDEGRRVVIEGETPLRMSDFGVLPPKKMGLITVTDEARLWVSLRARSLGKAE